MKKVKKNYKIIYIILSLLYIIMATSCSASEEKMEVKYVIGVSQANMRDPWRIQLDEELKEAADKYHNIKLIFMDATQNNKKQISDIEKLREYGIDLLIVSPYDVDGLTPTISNIYESIPVIVLDRVVTGYNYTLFIGPDNRKIGEKVGQSIVKDINSSDLKIENEINVLELMGGSRLQVSSERHEGFNDIVSENKRINIDKTVISDDSRDNAEDYIMSLSPSVINNTHYIFAHNDYMALGAYRAINKLGHKNIKIIGIDGFMGEDGGVEMVMDGRINTTVTCPTGGKEAIRYAIDILNQESGIPKQIILRSHTITKDTVEKYVKDITSKPDLYTNTIRVGHVQVGMESDFRKANCNSIIKAAKEFGIELSVIEGNQSKEEQMEAIRKFINQNMDVIVLSPVISSGWDETLREAKEAGIPVLLSDRNIIVDDEKLDNTFIGADFIEEGRRAMNWVLTNVSCVNSRKQECNSRINIMEIRGTEGATPTIERKQGFEEVMKNHPEYKILYSECGDFTYDGGYSVMKSYLINSRDNFNIDVLFCHNDDMTLGAIAALEESGIKPGSDIKIISVDGTKAALDKLREGKINCDIECSPLLGPQLMKAIKDLMNGEELPLRIITDEIVFTKDTPEEKFLNRGY